MVDAPAPDAAPEPAQALTPANQNPWYVLATLHGEQPEGATHGAFDKEIHAKNRLTWNKWAAGALSQKQRDILRERHEDSGQPVFSEQELTPYTAKEMVALKRRWRRQWTDRNPSQPVVPLPDPSQFVDYSSVHFDRPIIWEGIFSTRIIHFTGAKFSRDAILSNSLFFEFADFRGVEFYGYTSFCDIKFCRNAWFEKRNFFKHAHFTDSIFQSVWFESTIFHRSVDFRRSSFSDIACYTDVTFLNYAQFSEVDFFGDVWFSRSTFSNDAWFASATFTGEAWFGNAKLQSSTSFADARFILNPPLFHGATLHEGTQWHGARWPVPPDDAAQAQEHIYAYERLKQEMERLKKHDDELQFFEREMRCRRVVEGWSTPAGLLNRAYDLFSGYGRSIFRPMLGLLATFVLGIAAMVQAACWPGRAGSCPAILTLDSPFIAFKQATLLSFANMLAPLNVRKDFFDADMLAGLSGWLKIVGGLQTLLALAFAFLIGLALRNRFRLR
ncbi:pentapeptide repeat-containing protein [Bosea sp. RAC05]|uniref:pentapeptide repeat-containing protein n=1 Tax=Bosea sp. RAC05 TaxID=1842539 RepID=UPI000A7ECFE9